MQRSYLRVLLGGVLIAVTSQLHAEALQPDPAWQQGKLANGFSWQLLQTPQRPNDRIQMRLSVQTGSMMEKPAEKGFAYLIPKVVMFNSQSLNTQQLSNLLRNGISPDMPLPPAIVSYDFTLYNLSLPNNNPEVLKAALSWMADVSGHGIFNQETVAAALAAPDSPVATYPPNINDPIWRARLKGTTLQGFDPVPPPAGKIDVEALNSFYQRWYTPDMATLYVAGPVDKRALEDGISKAFGSQEGKRQTPVSVATLPPMKPRSVHAVNENQKDDMLALVWDLNWSSVKDSDALNRYWLNDLAREALFGALQQGIGKKNEKFMAMNMDCRMQYQRASCMLSLRAPNEKMPVIVSELAGELAVLKEKGISAENFDALIAMKQAQLQQLFAIYARTTTDILINQRLMSQQSNIIDIPPEQYQRLRQAFLNNLTPDVLNAEIHAILEQDTAFFFTQPKGETEMNVDQLRAQFDKIMHPEKAVAAAEKQAAAEAESAEKAAAEKAAAEKAAAEQAKAPAVTPEAAAPSQEAKPAEPKAPAPAKKGGQNGNSEQPAADNNTDGVSA
ncbi:M16 family metallopeptidase [Morganella morganii]|uniref:Insulinase family protein n=1 Tax=bacterium 19GA11TI05 TaxID=2920688 RepID=A0AAU6TVI0_UNCXX|nr:insulinase family protein [Morganella morganii]MDW7795443.1 insulinase family protein [Morganella morganii]HBL6964142.1 insulinase family protein [Morganella morganii]HDS3818264.1 insulinase family protein [Morganella morganii subsp. morganii]